MTREGKWPLAALVAAVLAAALLSACGGSDSNSDSGSSTEAAATGAATTAPARSGNGDRGQSDSHGSSSQDRNADKEESSSGEEQRKNNGGESSPKDVATPLQVSGGGSGQFRVKGGDNSIQEYGDEGDEAELKEVSEVVHGFFVARAEEKWDTACSYLAQSNIEQLQQLGAQSPKFEDAGCGPILEAFTRPLPSSLQREITTIDAGSFRHDDKLGFLIYYGAGGDTYAMPLRNEGGTWKVAALSGTALG